MSKQVPSEHPALMGRAADVELVRQERGSRVLFYPALEIVRHDKSRVRAVLIKQHGLSWRAGMTNREFRIAQREISDELRLPVSQLTQRTSVTVLKTLADAPAFAVATTVVPFRACRWPDERASAIERVVSEPVENVPHVVQLSFAPVRPIPEYAQTLPVAHDPTE